MSMTRGDSESSDQDKRAPGRNISDWGPDAVGVLNIERILGTIDPPLGLTSTRP